MRRTIVLLAILLLAACDLSTDPGEIALSDLVAPPANEATVVLTENLQTETGSEDMQRGLQYIFQIRSPVALPELAYDAQIGVEAAVVRIELDDFTTSGFHSTASDGVSFLFAAPDGRVFGPSTTCRINIVTPLLEGGTGQLHGQTDCPVTDGATDLRVLVKFDYSPG